MKIGIFSDVHGNIIALERVLATYDDVGVDEFVCLGDVVGYGPNPQECTERIRPLVKFCVLGNHDAAVAGRMDYGYYYDAARTALDHHAALISEENREWLANLPYLVNWEGLCFSHGSPVNVENFDYVFNPAQAASLLPHYDELAHVTFIGHSHLTKSYALAPVGESPRVEELFGPILQFEEGRKYIVTVGSVGQPRDNDARSCFTVYDTEDKTLQYYRLDYDISETARRVFENDSLAPDFGKRLFLGI